MHRFLRLAVTAIVATSLPSFATTPASPAPSPLSASEVVSALGDPSIYQLHDGTTLRVAPTAQGVRIRLGRRAPIALQADATGRFVSADGEVVLQFLRDDVGQPGEVRLTVPAAWM